MTKKCPLIQWTISSKMLRIQTCIKPFQTSLAVNQEITLDMRKYLPGLTRKSNSSKKLYLQLRTIVCQPLFMSRMSNQVFFFLVVDRAENLEQYNSTEASVSNASVSTAGMLVSVSYFECTNELIFQLWAIKPRVIKANVNPPSVPISLPLK